MRNTATVILYFQHRCLNRCGNFGYDRTMLARQYFYFPYVGQAVLKWMITGALSDYEWI